jgi:hypothetical protein
MIEEDCIVPFVVVVVKSLDGDDIEFVDFAVVVVVVVVNDDDNELVIVVDDVDDDKTVV